CSTRPRLWIWRTGCAFTALGDDLGDGIGLANAARSDALMSHVYSAKLAASQAATASTIGLVITPKLERFPLAIQRYDEPFLPFGKAVIQASRALVCAYIFDFAAYLKLGASGAIALERTIDYVGDTHVTVLHGAFALPGFVQLWDENAFGVDALTISDGVDLSAFSQRVDRAVYVVNAALDTMPNGVGIYDTYGNQFQINTVDGGVSTIRLAGEDVLYASSREDYAEVLRSSLEVLKHE
ncbi:MAG: hypothetical protein H7Y11_01490, partial [Armatimonadetes bacterium]|nr:hypothetical protein [Anaerolineae bacterium]